MKALVTGFEPFGGDRVNPSFEALERLPPRLGALDIATRSLPVVYGAALLALRQAIAETAPDIVLCIGLAGGRSGAIAGAGGDQHRRRAHSRQRRQPADRHAGGRRRARRPISRPCRSRPRSAALREAGLPAAVSNSAGTFLCNHVFFGLMHEAAIADGRFRGGFLHVPFLPSQAAKVPGAPSMALEQIVEGIEIILSVAAASG